MMSHTTFIRKVWIVAAVGSLMAGMTGCAPETSTTGSHGSRAVLYDTVDALAKDSGMVVVGTPLSQEEVRDLDDVTDFTVTTFEIAEVLQHNSADTPAPETGSTVEVRQLGTVEYDPIPAPILTVGKRYLLFLTPSGLEGEQATQFYVTGGNAGLYSAPADSSARSMPSFTQVQPEEGEKLPETIDLSEISQ